MKSNRKSVKPVDSPNVVALRGWAEAVVQNLIKLEKEKKSMETRKKFLAVQMNVGHILEKSLDCNNKDYLESLKNVPDELAGVIPSDKENKEEKEDKK